MPKISKLFKSKKSIEVSLVTLLELVLAVIVVMALIYLSLKLSGFFIGRQEYDSAINNMEALASRIQEMVNDRKPILTQTSVLSISDNYILVGFDYEDKGTMRTECTQETISASRPKICKGKSCLCIYQNFGGATDLKGKDFDDRPGSSSLKCKTFEDKIIFLAPQAGTNFKGSITEWDPGNFPGEKYSYLALYGRCGAPWRSSWGIKQIYIEKYSDANNNFIFIGDLSDEKVSKRKDYFSSGKFSASEKLFYRGKLWESGEYRKRLSEEERIREEVVQKKKQIEDEEKRRIEELWSK